MQNIKLVVIKKNVVLAEKAESVNENVTSTFIDFKCKELQDIKQLQKL